MPIPLLLLVHLTIPHSDLVAQATTEAGPWLTVVNIGLAGIGLWAFATGKIVAQGTYQRCEEKLSTVEEELRERNREARETLIPALTRATDLLARQLERRLDDRTPPPPNKGRP
jgi:hypothetical protein